MRRSVSINSWGFLIISVPNRWHLNGVVSVSLSCFCSNLRQTFTPFRRPPVPFRYARSVSFPLTLTSRGSRWGGRWAPFVLTYPTRYQPPPASPFRLRTHSGSRAATRSECDESQKSNSDLDNLRFPSFIHSFFLFFFGSNEEFGSHSRD